MRAVGRWLLSSFLSAVLTIASIGVAIAFAVALFVLVVSPWTTFDRCPLAGSNWI